MRSLYIFLLFTCVWANATISIIGVRGGSAVSLTGTPTIFGGLAGPACQGDGSQTCNSCPAAATMGCVNSLGVNQAPLCACNEKRIYDDLMVHISLKRAPGDVGDAKAQIEVPAFGFTHPVTVNNANGGNAIEFKWGEVCRAVGGVGCDSISPAFGESTLTIFIDSNSDGVWSSGEPSTTMFVRLVNPPTSSSVYGEPMFEGIGGFTPYPGDRKVYLENLVTTSPGFPYLSYGAVVQSVRVFISDKNMDNATPQSAGGMKDLALDSNALDLKEHILPNLKNGTGYFFRIGMLDSAGNVVQFYPGSSNLPPECTVTPDATKCPYAAVPARVKGHLN